MLVVQAESLFSQSDTKSNLIGAASRAIKASENKEPVKLPHAEDPKPVKHVKPKKATSSKS